MALALLIIYTAGLIALAGFGVHGLLMVYKYHRLQPSDPEMPSLDASAALPRVTVQLPLYNEMHVATRLLDAVCALDYPHDLLQIQILDDSTDETTALLRERAAEHRAAGLDVEHLHREHRVGFKAGALRDGLASASGAFIAIFDADFVPPRDFLRRTLPHLIADDGLGMVQTRWEHLNREYSLLTRVQAMALDAHFAMEQQVRNRSRYFMNFNGTAGVWRRACIEDAGNWHLDTLTEDLDISYRAQLRGWRFLYLNDVTVPAELPAEINGLKSQQFRWTKGAIETARKLLMTVWRSDQPLTVKLQATSHLTSNLIFPFVLVVSLLNVPMVLVKSSEPVLSHWFDYLGAFLVATVSTLLFYLSAQRDLNSDWKRRMLIFPIFIAGSMGLAVNNTCVVIEALVRRTSEFERTPKYNIVGPGDGWSSSRYRSARVGIGALVEIALSLYFLVGIILSIHFGELAVIPFQLIFLFGFGATGVLSIRHARGLRRSP
jgi:cellulose synthase/poly-beta-1,6-N-acetylglucosamine synthase-like glycosyltransferase